MSLTDPDRLSPVEPRWFAENKRFPNPAELLVVPDHYLFRMLASQGVALTDFGIPRADGGTTANWPPLRPTR